VFRLRDLAIDTFHEPVVFIHARTVHAGQLGFRPLDRVRVVGTHPGSGARHEIGGVLNFCDDDLLAPDEIGLSKLAFLELGLPPRTPVTATLMPAPASVDRVRHKLAGGRLERADFDAILREIVEHRYSKVELSMFVLACALRRLDLEELIELTRAMIACGTSLDFGAGPVADKHCVGGVPGNRTTMIVVPILAACGVTVPKTSSRAITSPAGTADTMGVLAEVALPPRRLHEVVSKVGGCIAWGGALDLAPADDILITVERPMSIDTEAQMVASILAKKKTSGATHALIDVPLGETAKVRSREEAEYLSGLFHAVAHAIGLRVEVLVTEVRAPIGRGIGPRLEVLDVLAVLRREPDAPQDLREKSLYLAAHVLEMVGAVAPSAGYRRAREALDTGAAARKLDEIVDAQGRREPPPPAPHRVEIGAPADGRIRAVDCFAMAKIAKLAGAPASPAAGIWLRRSAGDVVTRDEPLFEIHAQTSEQLGFAREYAEAHPGIYAYGY
jgi:thymidine phosphorylase